MTWPFCYAAFAAALHAVRFARSFEVALVLATVGSTLHSGVLGSAVLRAADALFRPDYSSGGLAEIYPVATISVAVSCFLFNVLVYTHHRLPRVFTFVRDDAFDGNAIAKRPVPDAGFFDAANRPVRPAAQQSRLPEKARAGFFDRLPVRMGRDLIYLKADDHYLDVYTVAGHGLLLMRLVDAVSQLGDLGLQVHRSYWVSRRHIVNLVKIDGRHRLLLSSGHHVPVSRTHFEVVRVAAAAYGQAR